MTQAQNIPLLDRPLRWYTCNDCRSNFQARFLAPKNRNSNCIQHFCMFYGKVITRKICNLSTACAAPHSEAHCIVPIRNKIKKSNSNANQIALDQNKRRMMRRKSFEKRKIKHKLNHFKMSNDNVSGPTIDVCTKETVNDGLDGGEIRHLYYDDVNDDSPVSSTSSTEYSTLEDYESEQDFKVDDNLLRYGVEKSHFNEWNNDSFLAKYTYIDVNGKLRLKKASENIIRFRNLRKVAICSEIESNVKNEHYIISENDIKSLLLNFHDIENDEDYNLKSETDVEMNNIKEECIVSEKGNGKYLMSMPNPMFSKLCDMGIVKYNKQMKRLNSNHKQENDNNYSFAETVIPEKTKKYLNVLSKQKAIASIGLAALYEHCAMDIIQKCIAMEKVEEDKNNDGNIKDEHKEADKDPNERISSDEIVSDVPNNFIYQNLIITDEM